MVENKRPKLLVLKGLPASGKTTHAKELESTGDWVRVNKDDIREMYFPDWTHKDEKDVLYIEDTEIIAELKAGNNVVVDDTNLHPKHQERLQKIADEEGAELEVLFIDTHPEECIKRNRKRQKSVPIEVIVSMYNKYVAPYKEERIEYDDSLEECIIVDMDGTLAHINGRSPYDSSRAAGDLLDDAVANVVNMAYGHGYKVIVLTGRHGEDLQVTKDWLKDNDVNYDDIFIREIDDTRPDYIIKRELFDKHIRGKYNVKYVIDDRPQVCREWRRMGLKVFQVGEPYVEF